MSKGLSVILTAVILIFGTTILADSFDNGFVSEKINNFETEITINKDSSLIVKESIFYDFGNNSRHGIFRNIPINNIKVKVKNVIDEFNKSYNYKVSKEKGYLKIKIGDPKKTIKGKHIYNIIYEVRGGVGFFQDHDELYWNVVGNDWEVPVEHSDARIYLPEKISRKDLKLDCFTGVLGLKERDCSFKIDESGTVYFESDRKLSPNEGLTIVLGWPKGIIKEPAFFQKFIWQAGDFWPLVLPFLAFIFLFRKWWRKGRDARLKKTVIAQYEPPDNLKPAEVNLILNQKVKTEDISATIIDLAVRGYIKIKEIIIPGIPKKRDYELLKLKDFRSQNDLALYEKQILENIFSSREKIQISELKNKVYGGFKGVISEIHKEITTLGYFTSNPKKTVNRWRGTGILIILASSIFIVFFKNFILGFSVIICGFLFFIFSSFMPKRTDKGREAYWHILGFREYINTAERYRLQFQEKEKIFEKYLPYAISFDLVNKWAKAFEGIYKTPPDWYEADFGTSFNTFLFVNSLGRSLSSMNNTFFGNKRVSGLSGSGFTGGGSGGGGGGSW